MVWDPNSEPNVVSYNVYYGAVSRVYSGSINVGNSTQFSLDGLEPGHWFLAVTAVTDTGEESDYSEELEIDTTPNAPPWVTDISPQTLDENGTALALLFAIGDAETMPENLSVVAESSEPSMLYAQAFPAAGSPSVRALVLQPMANASGVCSVSVTVSDGNLTRSTTFQVLIRPAGNDCLTDLSPPFPVDNSGQGAGNANPLALLSCGSSLQVKCAGGLDASGIPLQYTPPPFLDLCDPNPTVACLPPPGATFPMGTTVVVCSALDNSGNASQCSFSIDVQAVPHTSLRIKLLPGEEPMLEVCWDWLVNQPFELQAAESTPDPNNAPAWIPVQAPLQVSEGQCKVILPLGSNTRFFRLFKVE